MQITKTGCIRIPIKRFEDSRGVFSELYKQSEFSGLVMRHGENPLGFLQDNISKSKPGVVRGMHFQTMNPQGKLVRVIEGRVIDVVIDLRKDSVSYKQMEAFELEPSNEALFVPPGFAHGFWCLEETIFWYKCTQEYHSASDGGISPLKGFDYPWLGHGFELSDKDSKLPLLSDIEGSLPF